MVVCMLRAGFHPTFLPSLRAVLLLSSCIVCGACSGGRIENQKATIPVKGKVLVDGQPAANLTIDCVPAEGIDKANPTLSSAMTDKDGVFVLSTYKAGDGVPEGEYALTFRWGTLNTFRHDFEGDKLNGRYTDPKNSVAKFTVKKGQPTELGEIKLTTN
jgi:hypothetical protein